MTLTEAKVKIRAARALMRTLRAEVNSRGLRNPMAEIVLPREDFETLEWGMGHLLKKWIPEIDDDGEIVPGTEKLRRVNVLYTKPDGTDNFLFKGIPVRMRKEAA